MTAALLASKGFTASEQPLEAKRGWFHVMSTSTDYAALADPSFEILNNSYKPFACGLVVHPVIDGCLQLRNAHQLTPDAIDRIDDRLVPRGEHVARLAPDAATHRNPACAVVLRACVPAPVG